ncbi:MAG TPA: hypothetical protein VJV74_09460 [Terriglobia bacterium]|nr:hypothetical protein [Terriglobia bacterium]
MKLRPATVLWFVALLLALMPRGALSADGKLSLSATEIMARVAAHQDEAVKRRAEYVYQQRIRVATHRTNGKLVREETTDYLVTPTPDGTKKELKSIVGRYWHKGSYVDFHGEPVPEEGVVDSGIVSEVRDDVMNDKSKDSLASDLFPLTAKEQKKYRFELVGEETLKGRKVYRIKFRPADTNEFTWAGQALIDQEEFQPLSVFTNMSRNIPLWVRTLLGTNVPGLGFNVEYRRFQDGVWFPVSFGTEFRLRAVFFINREITVSLENSAFQRARAESKILGYQEQP